MKKYNNKRRKARLIPRRLLIFFLFIITIALIAMLGLQIYQGISSAIATGDQPVSTIDPTTSATATTTTFPTISVNAQLTSPRIVVYDVTHSAAIFEQDADSRCYPASLTKLLTAIIATEKCKADEVFTVGKELLLLQPGSSTAGLKTGFRLTRDMIIDALLLPSGNDAAYTIAVHVGRKLKNNPQLNDLDSIFAFTAEMNKKAQKLGASNSHFSNPDGYFSADHFTTAADMLKIANAAMKFDNIKQTVAKTSVRHVLLSGQDKTFRNTNKVIDPSSPYYFEGATGMKTGFTDEAGHCIIASAQRDGVEIIVVVMGGTTSEERWKDTSALLKEAYASYDTKTAG